MLDKDKFLDSIRETAVSKAIEIVESAKCDKVRRLRIAEKGLSESVKSEHEKAQECVELILTRRAASARIDASKILLSAKQKAVDTAYQQAKQSIISMSDAEYKAFISGLIAKYAEDGDKVVFAECDKKRMSGDFLKAVSTKLTVSNKTHSGQGGVILESEKCDKNLTIEALMKAVREETEIDVAKILFST